MELPDSSEDGGVHMCDPTVTSASGGGKKDKLCLVCGDKALGYNFNAVSCESCKAFFRRNAHKTIRGRCEGKCDVNVESRSFCKRCRLAKCFTVGMRKDMILNEEQKKVRKQKILYNKLRRQGHMPPEDHYSSSSNDVVSSATTSTPLTLSSGDSKVKQERSLSLSPSSVPSSSSPRDTSPRTYPSWADSQDLVAWAIEQMPEEQQKLVAELQFAMEQSEFLAVTSTSIRSMPSNPTEFVNMAEGFVRKVIKVAKNIASFKMLQKDDQISLLKGSVVDIMMLRSAVNYDPHTESWSLSTKNCLAKKTTEGATCTSPSTSAIASPSYTSGSGALAELSAASLRFPVNSAGFPQGSPSFTASSPELSAASFGSVGGSSGSPGSDPSQAERISADLLKFGTPETRQLFLNYSKFIKSLMSSIHGDLLVLKILIMMSLFSADRSALVQREKVQAVQENYATVLQQYSGLRFSEDKTLFARLVMKLTDLRNINEVHSKMLMKMKVEDIEPLLLEIFDL